jgi:hypothetical protein
MRKIKSKPYYLYLIIWSWNGTKFSHVHYSYFTTMTVDYYIGKCSPYIALQYYY